MGPAAGLASLMKWNISPRTRAIITLFGRPPYFISEERVFWQDYVKEASHVMAQKGWDRPVGMDIEIVPLTRPYGWPAGAVFKAQALFKGKPLKGVQVEIEKFNGFYVSKDKLPKDRLGEDNEPLMTRALKTDAQGYLVCTLDSPGWWVLAVGHEDGKKSYEGKEYPVEKAVACGFMWSRPRRCWRRRNDELGGGSGTISPCPPPQI